MSYPMLKLMVNSNLTSRNRPANGSMAITGISSVKGNENSGILNENSVAFCPVINPNTFFSGSVRIGTEFQQCCYFGQAGQGSPAASSACCITSDATSEVAMDAPLARMSLPMVKLPKSMLPEPLSELASSALICLMVSSASSARTSPEGSAA